ncbi:MAG: molybdopterin-dependent oxidoreductase [Steroidobacteraceae bacterium]
MHSGAEVRKEHTLCRVCHMCCSLIVEMEDGKPGRIQGDRDNPISQGFSCIRGREIANYGMLPSRLKTSLARNALGELESIGSVAAARRVATELQSIIERHGPRAVAMYAGGYCVMNTLTNTFATAFMSAIGSPMMFTPEPIDQPGKPIANALHGRWLAGTLRGTDGFDAMLLIGSNPLVSGGGPFGTSPAINLHQAKQTGTKLIVVDPRRTETARRADIHLQARPGTGWSTRR